jgi:hypothetical protein
MASIFGEPAGLHSALIAPDQLGAWASGLHQEWIRKGSFNSVLTANRHASRTLWMPVIFFFFAK